MKLKIILILALSFCAISTSANCKDACIDRDLGSYAEAKLHCPTICRNKFSGPINVQWNGQYNRNCCGCN